MSAGLLLDTWWTRGQSQLELAQIELGVSYELFVLDLPKEAMWYRRFYERASPRKRFRIFLSAMNLPELGTSQESELTGLSFAELELVWLAVHLAYMPGEGAEQDSATRASSAASARHVQMILMHRLTREFASG